MTFVLFFLGLVRHWHLDSHASASLLISVAFLHLSPLLLSAGGAWIFKARTADLNLLRGLDSNSPSPARLVSCSWMRQWDLPHGVQRGGNPTFQIPLYDIDEDISELQGFGEVGISSQRRPPGPP